MTVWRLFESAAARHGDRVAVQVQRMASVETSTYRDLHELARRYASALLAAGVRPGDRCAVLADPDAQWCAVYFGILAAGAIAVPLDTAYAATQVASLLGDATPRVLFASERLVAVARAAAGESSGLRILSLAHPPLTSGLSMGEKVEEDSPAVILYTSGTTAAPKGVVLTHANLLAVRGGLLGAATLSEADRVLGIQPLSQPLGHLWNMLLPLTLGARVVFLGPTDGTDVVRALSEHRITVLAGMPQSFNQFHAALMRPARTNLVGRLLFKALLAACFRLRRRGLNVGAVLLAAPRRRLGAHIRLLIVGGSKLDRVVARDLHALGFAIRRAYTLTEASGVATFTSADEAHIDTVGRALPGHEIRLLPREASGADGEIAVRGPAVMKGYYNRPAATAAVLRDGWLLTGDRGRLDSQQRLTITGKLEEMIVLSSGESIHPEEVEAEYRKSPFIEDVCVVALPGGDAEPELFAFVVPNMTIVRQRRIVNVGDLVRFELESHSIHLPSHKRVSAYEVCFDKLPRTTTGTLERHRLRQRVEEKRRLAASAPTAALSEWRADSDAAEVVAIISKRGAAHLSPDSNLEIDLGFDSMERVELIAELESRFGTRLSDHDVLTVQQLIDAVRQATTPSGHASRDASWATMLNDLPPRGDAALERLLTRRTVVPMLLFLALRTMRLLLPRIETTGLAHLPEHGPYIVAPNHQSYLDPFFICSVLPFRIVRQLFVVGATEYFETPVTAWLARQLNLVPVDPDAHLIPAMKAGAFGLTHGGILLLFPEGERSIDGTVKRFKKGAPVLAHHLGVPIVPVAIHGTFKLWPRNRGMNWKLLRPRSRHVVRLAFGAPVRVESAHSASAADQLRARVDDMWTRLAQADDDAVRAAPPARG